MGLLARPQGGHRFKARSFWACSSLSGLPSQPLGRPGVPGCRAAQHLGCIRQQPSGAGTLRPSFLHALCQSTLPEPGSVPGAGRAGGVYPLGAPCFLLRRGGVDATLNWGPPGGLGEASDPRGAPGGSLALVGPQAAIQHGFSWLLLHRAASGVKCLAPRSVPLTNIPAPPSSAVPFPQVKRKQTGEGEVGEGPSHL